MIENKLDLIYNKKYLVIVPQMSSMYYDALTYTFKNTILLKNNIDDIAFVTELINKNNIKQLIFVDYIVEYERILSNLKEDHEIKYIFTNSLGALSSPFLYSVFQGIYTNYKKRKVNKIGFLDNGMYETFRHKGDNVNYLKLDVEPETAEKVDSNTVGILSDENKDTHSFYNEMSAVKLTNQYAAKIVKCNKVTKKFAKTFDITLEEVEQEEVMKNNIVNLNVNFTENHYLYFIKSMDLGIPCLLGNSDLLDHYKTLKEYLVVKSDDDINEIKDKIQLAIKNTKAIQKEYLNFRKDYSKDSKKLVEEFLETEVEEETADSKEDLLITVVVPVYNTADYLEKSLCSIIDAIPEKTEILIINDGSTDNSEEIILKFKEEYPDIIRYIKQKNHGLGNVRNVGLKEAKGKYIASIDSDDTIHKDFFQDALEYLENDIDIVMCDWLTITNETKFETAALDYIFNTIDPYQGLLYTTIMPSTCNKIIKKSLFEDLKIHYIEDKYEDLSTNPFVMLKAKTIKYIPKPYYEYYIRSNSIMRSSAGLSMIDVLKIVEERLNKYKKYCNVDMNTFKYYTYSWRMEEYIMNQLYTIEEKELKNYIDYIEKNIKDLMLEIFQNEKYQDTINQLSKKDRDYIIRRNAALKTNKLLSFIKEVRKTKKYYKISPGVIYYGNQEKKED